MTLNSSNELMDLGFKRTSIASAPPELSERLDTSPHHYTGATERHSQSDRGGLRGQRSLCTLQSEGGRSDLQFLYKTTLGERGFPSWSLPPFFYLGTSFRILSRSSDKESRVMDSRDYSSCWANVPLGNSTSKGFSTVVTEGTLRWWLPLSYSDGSPQSKQGRMYPRECCGLNLQMQVFTLLDFFSYPPSQRLSLNSYRQRQI